MAFYTREFEFDPSPAEFSVSFAEWLNWDNEQQVRQWYYDELFNLVQNRRYTSDFELLILKRDAAIIALEWRINELRREIENGIPRQERLYEVEVELNNIRNHSIWNNY